MITQCASCHGQIRDCTGWHLLEYVQVPVLGWYHTDTGREQCEGLASSAKPVRHIDVRCDAHGASPDPECEGCLVSSEVSRHVHNAGRCVGQLCGWPHEEQALTTAGQPGLGWAGYARTPHADTTGPGS